MVRRLGARLHHLYQWALDHGPYAHIWDLCCDHGRLGLHLHQSLSARDQNHSTHVHLIDCVPSITDILKDRYRHILGPTLSVDCVNAGGVVLAHEGRQLLIIAGVGGGTVVDILAELVGPIASLCEQKDHVSFDIILSPNLHTFELRAFLRKHPFELLQEAFVSEKGQHHEHLLLRYQPREEVLHKPSVVGASLWHPLTADKRRYIQRFIKHYRACLHLGGDDGAQRAVDAYSELLRVEQQL